MSQCWVEKTVLVYNGQIQIQIQIQKKFIAAQENTNHNLPMQI